MPPANAQAIEITDFSVGIDRSRGRFPNDTKAFYDSNNVMINTGKRVRMRPPLIDVDGELDPLTQGQLIHDCQLYTIAKKGDVITNTGDAAALVSVLYFDNPDYCTDWELIWAGSVNNYPVAWIRHTFPGRSFSERVMLHVWDDVQGKPTYVEDPWCPTNVSPTWPLHYYNRNPNGEPIAWVDGFNVDPTVIGNAMWVPRPNGDVARSITGNIRYWNQWKNTDFLDIGEAPYYFVIPDNGDTLFEFLVSEDFSSLDDDRSWTGYVLEYLDENGFWRKFFQEDTSPTIDKSYTPVATAARNGDFNEIRLQVRWEGDPDVVIRFRETAGGPPLQVVDGGGIDTNTPSLSSQAGDGLATQFLTAITYADFVTDYDVYMESSATRIPLILGAGFHYTVANDGGSARIDFSSHRDLVLLVDGVLQLEYVTNIRFAAIEYVPQFPLRVYQGEDTTTEIVGATYSNDGRGFVKVTLPGGSVAQGDVFTVRFVPQVGQTVYWRTTARFLTGGHYLFEGEVYSFPAINLAEMPADSNLLVGIPHFPILTGPPETGVGGNVIFNDPSAPVGDRQFTVPAGVTQVTVKVWGGGGGGGGAIASQSGFSLLKASGGAGGGAGFVSVDVSVTPGDVLEATLGVGGAGGSSAYWSLGTGPGGSGPTSGSTGVASTVNNNTTATLLGTANGGAGGGAASAFAGGAGGVGGTASPSGNTGATGGTGVFANGGFAWPADQAGGIGGASGAGDTFGQGGNGATCLTPTGLANGSDGQNGRVEISWGEAAEPWFVDPTAPSMPLNGYERYHINLKYRLVTDNSGPPAVTGEVAYEYGNEPGRESRFYFERLEYYTEIAGFDDATFLATSMKAGSCGLVVSLTNLGSKLCVHYSGASQLWAIGSSPLDNAYLGKIEFGSRGPTQEMLNGAMILTESGFRMMFAGGDLLESLVERNHGQPLDNQSQDGFQISDISNAAFWPHLGLYVGVTTTNGQLQIWSYAFYSDYNVTAWNKWSVRDMVTPAVESLQPLEDRLYMRTGNVVRYFDASRLVGGGTFVDTVDQEAFDASTDSRKRIEDFKYPAFFRTHNLAMGDPRSHKLFTGVSVEQVGSCRLDYYESVRESPHLILGSTHIGSTYEGYRHPLGIRAKSLGVVATSVDPQGWELNAFTIDVIKLPDHI